MSQVLVVEGPNEKKTVSESESELEAFIVVVIVIVVVASCFSFALALAFLCCVLCSMSPVTLSLYPQLLTYDYHFSSIVISSYFEHKNMEFWDVKTSSQK